VERERVREKERHMMWGRERETGGRERDRGKFY